MQLDLRAQQALPLSFAQELNEVAWDIRACFNSAIDEISRSVSGDPAWLVSNPASRNTLQSPVFQQCAEIALLQKMAMRGEYPDQVVTDSPALAAVLEKMFAGTDVKVIRSPRPSSFRLFLSGCLTALGVLNNQIRLMRGVKRMIPKADLRDVTPLILIDTFVIPGFEDKDRYYPGLFDFLSEKEARSVFFVPTIIGVNNKNSQKTFELLKSSSQSFLYKEHFLTWLDLIRCMFSVVKGCVRTIPRTVFNGIDISGLIKEDLRSLTGLQASLTGLLNIRFAKRLSDSKATVRSVLNWFENQAVDRGWHLGFHKYFPEAKTTGYQGFPPIPLYLCSCPTEGELRAGSVPLSIAVIGEKNHGVTDEFCPDLKLSVAPAFRYPINKAATSKTKHDDFKILVALTCHADFARYVVAAVREAAQGLDGVRVVFKSHPLHRPQDLMRMFDGDVPPGLISGDEDVMNSFADCDMVIGGHSSTSLQALALGKPVVEILWPSGVNLFFRAFNCDQRMHKECANSDELRHAVDDFRNAVISDPELFMRLGDKIRSQYFSAVTREAGRQLLGLSG